MCYCWWDNIFKCTSTYKRYAQEMYICIFYIICIYIYVWIQQYLSRLWPSHDIIGPQCCLSHSLLCQVCRHLFTSQSLWIWPNHDIASHVHLSSVTLLCSLLNIAPACHYLADCKPLVPVTGDVPRPRTTLRAIDLYRLWVCNSAYTAIYTSYFLLF